MSTFSALVLATLAFAEGSEAVRARVVLVAPTPHTITPLRQGVELPESSADAMRTQIFVEVLDFDGQVEDTPLRGTWGAGVVRRGTVLPAVRKRPRQGCGLWAALPDGGGFCSGRGVVFHATPALAQALTIAPDLDADLPYRYGEVTEAGTIRYARLPTADELAAAENG